MTHFACSSRLHLPHVMTPLVPSMQILPQLQITSETTSDGVLGPRLLLPPSPGVAGVEGADVRSFLAALAPAGLLLVTLAIASAFVLRIFSARRLACDIPEGLAASLDSATPTARPPFILQHQRTIVRKEAPRLKKPFDSRSPSIHHKRKWCAPSDGGKYDDKGSQSKARQGKAVEAKGELRDSPHSR